MFQDLKKFRIPKLRECAKNWKSRIIPSCASHETRLVYLIVQYARIKSTYYAVYAQIDSAWMTERSTCTSRYMYIVCKFLRRVFGICTDESSRLAFSWKQRFNERRHCISVPSRVYHVNEVLISRYGKVWTDAIQSKRDTPPAIVVSLAARSRCSASPVLQGVSNTRLFIGHVFLPSNFLQRRAWKEEHS